MRNSRWDLTWHAFRGNCQILTASTWNLQDGGRGRSDKDCAKLKTSGLDEKPWPHGASRQAWGMEGFLGPAVL